MIDQYMKGMLTAVVVFSLLSSSPVGAQHPAPPEAPDVLESRFENLGPPVWVSHRAATKKAGGFDWTKLRAAVRPSFEKAFASEEYRKLGCLRTHETHVTLGDPPKASSFTQLVENSLGAYLGTVERHHPGFWQSQPGTLLRVRLDQSWSPSSKLEVGNFFYVFYPAGEFEAGGYRFCPDDPRYPTLPSRGSRILVLPSYPPIDEGRSVIYPYVEEIFVEDPEGLWKAPLRWRGELERRGVETFSDLLQGVKLILGKEPQ